jgi:acyl-CoA dehydrogenase
MDTLLFDEDHLEIQKMLQKFAQKEVAPLAVKRDEEEHFEWGTFQKMGENGLTGIPWPEEYGGAGMDYVAFINAIEEFSKVCGATGSDLAIHTALGSFPIYTFGTEEQKQKYLRALATGEKMGAFGLTEPNHGSNYQTLQTRAVKDGNEYVLNGQKAFISNAGPAGIYIVFATTEPSAKNKEGLSAFIVEKGTEGFTLGKPEKKMGIRGHVVAPMNFEDCRIPAENLLGSEGDGFKIAKQTLFGGRMAMSAQALGLAQGAYEHAVEYVKSREQFDKKLSDFQTIRFKLADMAIQLETMRLLVYQAAMLWTKGEKYSIASAMSKAYVSETAMKLTTDVVQLFGGYGFTRDYPVERMMRDTKITSIYTGTAEMQRIEISDEILEG